MKSNYLTVIISLIIILIVAGAVIYHAETKEHETVANASQLISPPRSWKQLTQLDENGEPLMMEQSYGKWTLVYVIPKQCDAECKKVISNLYQIPEELGKKRDLLRLGVESFLDQPKDIGLDKVLKDYPEIVHFYLHQQDWAKLMAGLSSTPIALSQGYIYLVSPDGNILIGYPTISKPINIFRDLKLLTES